MPHTHAMIKSGHRSTSDQCPLYPKKRTLVERVGMSALCQKRTHALHKKAVAALRLPRFRPRESAALQALGGPDRINIVEFRNRLGAGWQRHPRLLGGRVNMDVWRAEIRVVHRPDANETDGGTGLRIVAPNRHPARRATRDLLALAALRGRHDDFRFTGGVHDAIGFIE